MAQFELRGFALKIIDSPFASDSRLWHRQFFPNYQFAMISSSLLTVALVSTVASDFSNRLVCQGAAFDSEGES